MFSKIKFFFLSLILFSIGIATIGTIKEVKDFDSKINHTASQSFEDFKQNDPDYKKKSEKIRKNNGTLHPIDETTYVVERLIYEKIDLRIKYRVKSWWYFCVKSFFAQLNWNTLYGALYLSTLLLVFPLFFRTFLYFCVAPLLGKSRPVKFFKLDENVSDLSISIKSDGEKSLPVEINPNQSLIVISENYVNGYNENPNLKKKMRWLFSWHHPFMSLLCGLSAMNCYQNDSQDVIKLDITSENPDDYFVEIELKDCAGAFIVPSHIKAFSDGISISCKWNLLSFASFCMKRFRYYSVSGSGKIVLSCAGGFSQKMADSNVFHRRKPSSFVFSSANLDVRAKRTELFYPYLIGRTELFDIILKGNGNFLIKNTLSNINFFDKLSSPDSILNVVGKLFGF